MKKGANGENPDVVAEVILKPANSTSNQLRFAVGKPAPLLHWKCKLLPDTLFFKLAKASYKI